MLKLHNYWQYQHFYMGVRIGQYKRNMKVDLETAKTTFFDISCGIFIIWLYNKWTNQKITNIYILNDNIVGYRHQWAQYINNEQHTHPHISVWTLSTRWESCRNAKEKMVETNSHEEAQMAYTLLLMISNNFLNTNCKHHNQPSPFLCFLFTFLLNFPLPFFFFLLAFYLLFFPSCSFFSLSCSCLFFQPSCFLRKNKHILY